MFPDFLPTFTRVGEFCWLLCAHGWDLSGENPKEGGGARSQPCHAPWGRERHRGKAAGL